MPELSENKRYWDGAYGWAQAGDEWSAGWGGPDMQWWGTLFPRLHGLLPAARIVEIAPGYGRWTHYLAGYCDDLTGIDLSSECVKACRVRFAGDERLRFAANDGKSLAAVADGAADLVFSFDSLVHVESDVIASYLQEVRRVLSPDGGAFLHHSNLARYPLREARAHNEHWRALSVSGECVRAIGAELGLRVVSQEQLVWGGNTTLLSDCISVLCLPGSCFETDEPRHFENWNFTEEMRRLRRLSETYSIQDRRDA